MGNNRNRECLGKRGNLTRLGDAADAVGVELDVIDSTRFEQVPKAMYRELMLASRDRNHSA